MLADAAARPMQSWQALQDAVAGAGTEGEAALEGAADAADQFDESITAAGRAAGGAGAARPPGAEAAKTGWAAAVATLADYAAKARDIGGDIGQTLVGHSARRKCRRRVRQNRQARLPRPRHLDDRRSGETGGPALHPRADRQCAVGRAGRRGRVVRGHPAFRRHGRHRRGRPHGASHGLRKCTAHAFRRLGRAETGRGARDPAAGRAGSVAPRGGGLWPGTIRAPAVNVTIMARDAESFRQSRTQVAADIARAVSLGRRGM